MITTVKDAKIVTLSKYTDNRGSLVPIESGKDIDLIFRRSFFVFDVPKNQSRGYHAHKISEQLLICPFGKCTVTIRDGAESRDILLDSPEVGLYVPAMIWNEILYEEENSFLLALTTETYSKDEYVSDWREFSILKGCSI
jgi:UDP-2-acetamido-3-amino-2,3-dideoxy-glucuronate N-acetyltransferase